MWISVCHIHLAVVDTSHIAARKEAVVAMPAAGSGIDKEAVDIEAVGEGEEEMSVGQTRSKLCHRYYSTAARTGQLLYSWDKNMFAA
ncbi:MAG: hypothetical protein PHO26_01005 [Dehalococcoidia bacterium]|nr:hypothetical protein [Dehalococcoidia bacterium]MDD5493668.1 hypothetical protein [Dehalococcoidia bacterium]